ncbi:MAG: polysaccharide deacetylase family protein, partial [Pseudonocardiaceae bacterium]
MTIIPILLYHSVSADPAPWIAPYTVTPQVFARHVELMATSGRTALTVSQLYSAIAGLARLPERPLLVTFDDGFADFAEAARMLAARGLPSTLYVTTGALRGRGPRHKPAAMAEMALPPASMLDWSQLAELTEQQVEIGAHTHTHPQLDVLRPPVAAQEIRLCKDLLEEALGHAVPSFAYPHGFHRAAVRRLVREAGYTSACAVGNALSSRADHVLSLARLTVRADTTGEKLAAWLAGRDAPVAPYPERLRTRAWRLYRRARGSHSSRGVVTMGLMLLAIGTLAPAACGAPPAAGPVTPLPPGTYAFLADTVTSDLRVINTATLTPVGSPIKVNGVPSDVAVSRDGQRAYVISPTSNDVQVIDTRTRRVLGDPIRVGPYPSGIAVSPDGTRIYVADGEAADVRVIDTGTRRVLGTPIKVGDAPSGVAVSPDGKWVYVTSQYQDDLRVIDTRALQVFENPVKVGHAPARVVVSPDGSRVFVANLRSDDISVIDTRTLRTVGNPIGVGHYPYGMVISPDGLRLYVSDQNSGDVRVIDTATLR